MHDARLGVLRALVEQRNLRNPVLALVELLTKNNQMKESVALINKYSKIDRTDLVRALLQGVVSSVPPTVTWRMSDAIHELIDPKKNSMNRVLLHQLAHVYSVHGIHPKQEKLLSGSIPELKRVLQASDSVLLIGCLRKLKSERQFLWDTYVKYWLLHPKDSPLLTQYMAEICAINGWFNRVDQVLNRCHDSVIISKFTAAKFVKAFCHFPLGEGARAVIDRIVEMSDPAKCEKEEKQGSCLLGVCLVEFYAINGQYSTAYQYLEWLYRNDDSESLLNGFRLLLKRVPDAKLFFALLSLARREFKVNPLVQDKRVLDKALRLASGSPRTLLSLLEVCFVDKIEVNVLQRSRAMEVATASRSKYLKRISELLELLEKA